MGFRIGTDIGGTFTDLVVSRDGQLLGRHKSPTTPEDLSVGVLECVGLAAAEIAMVGDRLYTDVLMARRAGALGVLVLTGEATAEDAARSAEPPDLTLPSLVELGDLLASSRS